MNGVIFQCHQVRFFAFIQRSVAKVSPLFAAERRGDILESAAEDAKSQTSPAIKISSGLAAATRFTIWSISLCRAPAPT